MVLLVNSATPQEVFSDYGVFEINSISAYVRNDGMLHNIANPATVDPGFEWPRGSGTFMIYASNLWLAAKVGNEVRTAAREYGSTFNPGPMNPLTRLGADPADSVYRVYSISRGDTSSADYRNWPASLGAPVDLEGRPRLVGDQTLWCVYNCAESAKTVTSNSKPLGVEVQQTAYGTASLGGLFKNLMIVRFLIINKSGQTLDSMYAGLWSDPDVGDPSDDRDGCDSALSLWYCYNATDTDYVYGAHPPAVGYVTLEGPRVASPRDSALFLGRRVTGARNLPMGSFVLWPNDAWSNPRTPDNIFSYFKAEWWAYDRHITYGGIGTDPDAPPTNFMYSGDPESGTGWLSHFSRHEFSGSGPFMMAPGDTQEVVVGFLVSRGSSNTNSVTKLRNETRVLLGLYADTLYRWLAAPRAPAQEPELPELYGLSQNFPNPFNPGTELTYSLPVAGEVTLAVYNMLGQRVAVLASGFHPAGTYNARWEPSSLPSGAYVYQLEAGRYVKSRRMILVR